MNWNFPRVANNVRALAQTSLFAAHGVLDQQLRLAASVMHNVVEREADTGSHPDLDRAFQQAARYQLKLEQLRSALC